MRLYGHAMPVRDGADLMICDWCRLDFTPKRPRVWPEPANRCDRCAAESTMPTSSTDYKPPWCTKDVDGLPCGLDPDHDGPCYPLPPIDPSIQTIDIEPSKNPG